MYLYIYANVFSITVSPLVVLYAMAERDALDKYIRGLFIVKLLLEQGNTAFCCNGRII